jgi:tartrate/fumarate subfamily iron-sulfur-dependent hydro-lyase alpha chain
MYSKTFNTVKKTMIKFDYDIIPEVAKKLYIKALCDLPVDVREALKQAYKKEKDPTGKAILKTILRSVSIADREKTLICQDTGLPVYMIKIGNKFHWDGWMLKEKIYHGTKKATQEFPFRSSSTHPLTRINPQTSVGIRLPVFYFDFIKDADYLDILMVPKGSGSENMSAMKMFIPAEGLKAIKKFILETVVEAGGNPCPPGIIGVGIGGTSDLVMRLAKEAIVRPVGQRNSDPELAALEEEMENLINSTGIGPMGLGGSITTLAVHIEMAYTHITQNPVAVNYQCWAARRARARIYPDGKVEYGY